MAQHNDLGNKGELRAKGFLQQQGYTVLHCNWRYKHKEIDIVVKKENCLIFIEVKTRNYGGMQAARESITQNKMRYLVEAADAYITTYDRKEEARFDLLAITNNKGNWQIEHIKDAFNAMDL